MRKKTTSKRSPKSSFKRALLLTVVALASLVVLFFLSFWITSLSLKASQGTLFSKQSDIVAPSKTTKPTYEQLEQMVADKDREIKRLEEELARYHGDSPAVSETPAPAATPSSKPTKTPAPTKTPEPTKTPTPSNSPSPSVAPTKTPEPSKAPIEFVSPNAGAANNE